MTDGRAADGPLTFVPFLRPMAWGGRRLAETLRKPLPSDAPFGESWELSDHPLHRSSVAAGPLAGRSLRHLMEQEPAALLGGAWHEHPVFPWLVKFLDAHDRLSVQVHPDATAVRRLLPGEGSKTEAWFVLDAAPGSRIYAGLLPGTDEAILRRRLREGRVTECLHTFEPQAGDCVFLPAGTVHAVGGGVLIAEVQQTSDATFRLYDWDRSDAQGRPRELHIEQAMQSIDWAQGPVTPVHAPEFSSGAAGATVRRRMAECRHFRLDYVHSAEALAWGGTDRLHVLVVLRGSARWDSPDTPPAVTGTTWLLPAAMPSRLLRPDGLLAILACSIT